MSTVYRFSIGTSNPGTAGIGLCFDYVREGPRDDAAACVEATECLERELVVRLEEPLSRARVYIDPKLTLTGEHIVMAEEVDEKQ